MLIEAALLFAQVSVEGLRTDESLTVLAPSRSTYGTEAEEYILRCGRVLDAFTLQPVVGAQVEVWTEEVTEETGGFRRLGFAHTGETGQFILNYKEGDVDADKSRISAEGYATLTRPAGEITSDRYTLLYPIDRPLKVRFVDTDGRAIQSGRVTSTRTCAHDIYAMDAHADSTGTYVLHGVGPQREIPELRFRAPGYQAIKYIDTKWALSQQDQGKVAEWIVPRQVIPRVRMLDRDGNPLSEELLYVVDNGGFHVVRTTKEGILHFPGLYGTGRMGIRSLGNNRSFGDPLDWQWSFNEELVLHEDQPDFGERELATIRIAYKEEWTEEGWQPGFQAVHEEGMIAYAGHRQMWDGWTEFEIPAGRVQVGWGGPFNENVPGRMFIEIEPGETLDLYPKVERAIEVQLELPENVGVEWIEAQHHSTSLGRQSSSFHISPGQQARILLTGPHGTALKEIGPFIENTTLSWHSNELPELLIAPSLPPLRTVRLQRLQPSTEEWFEFAVYCTMTEDWIECGEGDSVQIQAHEGSRLLISGSDENELTSWRTLRVSAADEQVLVWESVQPAGLELELPDGYSMSEAINPRLGERIPPGPIDLFIDGPDSRIGLRLNLIAGEQRKLVLHVD